jgi:outer membrane protein assembly factor BamB
MRRRAHVRAAVAELVWLAACTLLNTGNASENPLEGLRQLWRQPIAAAGEAVLHDNTAYVLSTHHSVHAIDTTTGGIRWSSPLAILEGSTVGSRLTQTGELLMVPDSDIFGIAPATGAIRWRFSSPLRDQPGLYLGASAGGLVFTGSESGRVHALDALTGSEQWSAAAGAVGARVFAPIADEELVVARLTTFGKPDTGALVALAVRTGEERWRFTFSPDRLALAGGPLFVEDLVVISSREGEIIGLDRGTGSVRWSLPPLRPSQLDFRALANSGRRLFAASLSGVLVAYDLATRAELWRFSDPFAGSMRLAIKSDEDFVYVPYFSGRVSAVDVKSGLERWRVGSRSMWFGWAPTVAGDSILLAGGGGIFAFRRS